VLLLCIRWRRRRGTRPREAAKPLPIRLDPVTLDLEIGPWAGGYLLLYRALEDERVHGVSWFDSLAGAEVAAQTRFGVLPGEWEVP